MGLGIFFLSSSPCLGGEHYYYREQLESAHKHKQAQKQLDGGGEKGEVAHRAYKSQTGTYVAQAGNGGGEAGGKIKPVQTHQKSRSKQDNHVQGEKCVGGAYGVLVQRGAVETYYLYLIGTDKLVDTAADAFEQDDDSGDLDSAAGASRAGAYKHQQHQHKLGCGGPQGEVRNTETGGGDYGRYVEE